MSTAQTPELELLEALPTPAVAVDEAGKVILWNAAMAELTGRAPQDVLGKKSWAGWFDKRQLTALDGSLEDGAPCEDMLEIGGASFVLKAAPVGDSASVAVGTLTPAASASAEIEGLDEAETVLRSMAVNDFTKRVEGSYDGISGRLAETINQVQDRLLYVQEIVQNVANGDLHELQSLREIGQRSKNDKLVPAFVAMMGNLQRLIDEMNRMSKEHDAGDIDVIVPEEAFEGAFRVVAKGVNDMVAGHITVKKKAMACVAEFAKGNFDAPLEKFPGKKAFINDNVEQLRGNVKRFIEEMSRMSREHDAGDIDVVLPEEEFEGAYRVMAKGVNDMVAGHITVKKKAMACVAEFGRGNFNASLEKFPGKKAFINDTIETLRGNLRDVASAVVRLTQAAKAGQLDAREDPSAFRGDWADLIRGLNLMLDSILAPISDAAAALERLAQRDLRARVDGEFEGDHAKIKNSVNTMAKALDGSLAQVAEAVEQISAASGQIAAGSQAVAQGASEQASSLEETSSSMEEMASMTAQNADNTQLAKSLADGTQAAANKG
ncbi:MAG: PAS domain-containing protein, partial [Myxococcota bacterium]